MKEAEWLTATEPSAMVDAVWRKASDRKLRLFACASCRRIWHLMPDEACRIAVETSERFADRLASRDELVATLIGIEAQEYREDIKYRAATAAWHSAASISRRDVAFFAAYHAAQADESDAGQVRGAFVILIRCVFGNPFRPVRLDPSCRTEAVVSLARGIYEDRAFDRMPVLADALEDAGCSEPEILNHCRGDGLHVRGCWVVDLLLGKE